MIKASRVFLEVFFVYNFFRIIIIYIFTRFEKVRRSSIRTAYFDNRSCSQKNFSKSSCCEKGDLCDMCFTCCFFNWLLFFFSLRRVCGFLHCRFGVFPYAADQSNDVSKHIVDTKKVFRVKK